MNVELSVFIVFLIVDGLPFDSQLFEDADDNIFQFVRPLAFFAVGTMRQRAKAPRLALFIYLSLNGDQ